MKKITIELIRSFSPCYDPVSGLYRHGESVNQGYLPEDYEATLLEFLRHPEIPAQDKLWLVLRRDFISDKTLRLFAVWCAREAMKAMKLVDNPDAASIDAINVVERYANGKATDEELEHAINEAGEALAARVAVTAARAAEKVARRAAWAAADAARDAARAARAARDAARDAAWDAAADAADAERAAAAAARDAAAAAWDAGADAAWDAREEQLKQLISMIENPTLHEGAQVG